MRNGKSIFAVLCAGLVLASMLLAAAPADKQVIGINVVLKVPVTSQVLANLAKYGKIRDTIPAIKALTMQAPASQLAVIRALPYVAAANPDAERTGAPVDTVAATNFVDGLQHVELGRTST